MSKAEIEKVVSGLQEQEPPEPPSFDLIDFGDHEVPERPDSPPWIRIVTELMEIMTNTLSSEHTRQRAKDMLTTVAEYLDELQKYVEAQREA